MIFKKVITFYAFALILSGCVSNNNIKPEEIELLNAIKNNPENSLLIGQAGDFYRKKYLETKENDDADKAIQYYEEFLSREPTNINALILIYDTYYTLHQSNAQSNLQRLTNSFDNIPKEQRIYLNPPAIAEAYRTTSTQNEHPTIELLKNLAAKGIEQSPKAPLPYLLLSNIYLDKGSIAPAIAILKRGVNQQPDNAILLTSLADAYVDSAYSDDCFLNNMANWTNAIGYYTQAKKIDSNNATIRSGLQNAYFALNKTQLGLYEAKAAYRLSPSADTFISLVKAYKINDMYKQVKELLHSKPEYSQSIEPIIRAEIALESGDWDESLSYFKQHRFDTNDKNSLYNFIQANIASEQSQLNWLPQGNIEKSAHSPWQKKLLYFWQGKTSAENLLISATDNCKKIEANTYIGYRHLANNSPAEAKYYLEAAVSQNIPLFVEQGLAQQLLKKVL